MFIKIDMGPDKPIYVQLKEQKEDFSNYAAEVYSKIIHKYTKKDRVPLKAH